MLALARFGGKWLNSRYIFYLKIASEMMAEGVKFKISWGRAYHQTVKSSDCSTTE